MENQNLKVAILSMYLDLDAQGLRYIQSLLKKESENYPQGISYTLFQTRANNEMPALEDFDLFISTGGPGNPFDGEGSVWEDRYFEFLNAFQVHNDSGERPKFHFSICHSFQLLCRFFNIARVSERPKSRLGIFECFSEAEGQADELFGRLPQPFLLVENRSWQCISPDHQKMQELGIKILAREGSGIGRESDTALLALRISPFWISTQFHPETNPEGMRLFYSEKARQENVRRRFGQSKLDEIFQHLDQTNPALADTWNCLLPGFIRMAMDAKILG